MLIFVCLAVLATGCSTFNRDWTNAAAVPPPTNDITGRWEGEWHSDANGHHGRLRCLITQLDGTHYRARYRASWGKIFHFGYTVDMRVERSDNLFRFEGGADLGRLAGGMYRYDGRADSTNFVSNYKSRRDHGTFQMARPR